ncbi:MAG: helix-turn-helix transcriptional regulator [Clostridiales bacterium]|nr:helix-turn-helix transcriptional regulator [Clostridiales bacterium]
MYKIFNNSAEIISRFNSCLSFCSATGLSMYAFGADSTLSFCIYNTEMGGALPSKLSGIFDELLSRECGELPEFLCTPYFGSYFCIACGNSQRIVAGPSFYAPPDEKGIDALLSSYGGFSAAKKDILEFYARSPVTDYRAFANQALLLGCMLNGTEPDFEALTASGRVIPLPDKADSGEALWAGEYAEPIPFDLLGDIISAVHSGVRARVSAVLKDVAEWNFGYRGDSPIRTAKNTFTAFAALMCREANVAGLDRRLCFALSEYYTNYAEAQTAIDELLSLFIKLLYDLTGRIGRLDGESTSELTSAVKKYIRAHITESISLSDLSSGVNFSVPHICRKFRQDTGRTVNSYIHELKISEACRLIAESDVPPSEVWLRFGYSDQSHFNKVFKNVTGTTPGAYRLRCAEGKL